MMMMMLWFVQIQDDGRKRNRSKSTTSRNEMSHGEQERGSRGKQRQKGR